MKISKFKQIKFLNCEYIHKWYDHYSAANGVGEYMCMDTVLKSHATVYHLYRKKYYKTQRGKISITINSKFMYGVNSTNDIQAEQRERAQHFQVSLEI